MFCVNAVDKTKIDHRLVASHQLQHDGYLFQFASRWHYSGTGEQQSLQLTIDRHAITTPEAVANDNSPASHHHWQDEHTMVAISFAELTALLEPWFDVYAMAHDYHAMAPLAADDGNAIFVCVKREHAL